MAKGLSQPSPCSQPRPPPDTPRLCLCCSRPPTLTLRTLSSTVSALSPWALLASPLCPQCAQVRPCTCPWPRPCPCRPWAPPWPFCPWARCTQQDPPCCWRGAWTALPGWAQVALLASSRRPPGAPRVPPRCRSRPEPPSCCPPARGASRGGPGGASASGEGGPSLGVPPAPLGVPPRSAPPPRNLHWAWGPQRWGGIPPPQVTQGGDRGGIWSLGGSRGAHSQMGLSSAPPLPHLHAALIN